MAQTSKPTSHVVPIEAAICTALISALAVPILYGLNQIQSINQEVVLALVAVLVCAIVFFLSYQLVFSRLPEKCRHDWYLAWFSLFAFTAIVDLVLAFNILGEVHVIDWYLSQGEKYLQSAYGYAINLWDGTMHWLLYIVMVYALSDAAHKTFRPVYLYWVGSIMFSLFAFLPGAAIGAYSHDIKLSSFLNVPYAVIPLYFLNRVLRQDSYPCIGRAPLVSSLFFLVAFTASILVAFVRFCAAANSNWTLAVWWRTTYEPILDDDTRFFHLQAYVSFYYLVPFYLIAIYSILFGTSAHGSRHVADISALIAGGVAQTQFSLLASVFCTTLTPKQYQFPGNDQEKLYYFLICGGLLAVVPTLFALQCHFRPVFPGLLGPSERAKVA